MVHWSWSPLELLELLEFVPQKKVHKDSKIEAHSALREKLVYSGNEYSTYYFTLVLFE